jgi:dolichyl-phosphate beta-glucosyltransferase
MMATPDITLILPAFNEAKRIRQTIEEAVDYLQGKGYAFEIIVAADGEDGTREIVKEMSQRDSRLQVIGSSERRGKGRGIREAVEIARGAIIGYADADNKVPIEDFDKLEPLLKEGYPVVIGSRGLPTSRIDRKQPWFRRVGSKGFYYFMQTAVGLPGIHDTQCGFKFFEANAAKTIFGAQQIDGYMFDVEILALARKLGMKIAEIPIRWRDDADSRLELVRGNLQNVKDIFRIRLSLASRARTLLRERQQAEARSSP